MPDNNPEEYPYHSDSDYDEQFDENYSYDDSGNRRNTFVIPFLSRFTFTNQIIIISLLLLSLLIFYMAQNNDVPEGETIALNVPEVARDIEPKKGSGTSNSDDIDIQYDSSYSSIEEEEYDSYEDLDENTSVSNDNNPTLAKRLSPNETFYITGNTNAGDLVKFHIKAYDPTLEYYIELGNGQRLKALRETSFRYLEPGSYKIVLTMRSPDNQLNYSIRYLKINTIETESSREIIADVPAVENPETIEKNTLPDTNIDKHFVSTEEVQEVNSNGVKVLDTSIISKANTTFAPKESPDSSAEATKSSAIIVNTAPLTYAEKMPSFPGGNLALKKFFNDAVSYPQMALENEIEGKVFVRFIVNSDGSISDPTVVKGIGFGCDEEALKVIRRMPQWVPGEQKGLKVQVVKTLPINFRFK